MPAFALIVHTINFNLPIEELENNIFETGAKGGGAMAVGFILFFLSYSTFLVKLGFYIEDLFVRKCYRRKG